MKHGGGEKNTVYLYIIPFKYFYSLKPTQIEKKSD
jgi:hypothetical protein